MASLYLLRNPSELWQASDSIFYYQNLIFVQIIKGNEKTPAILIDLKILC